LEKVEPKTKEKSTKLQGNNKASNQDKEDVYNIEALLEKKGSKYLVKWENYSKAWDTWEPKTSIPKFILKYYEEDLTRLGKPAPSEEQEEYSETEEDEFVIENILKKRISNKSKVEYLIKWENYDQPKDNTWEPADNIVAYKQLLEDFEKKLIKKEKEDKKIKMEKINPPKLEEKRESKTQLQKCAKNPSEAENYKEDVLQGEKKETKSPKKLSREPIKRIAETETIKIDLKRIIEEDIVDPSQKKKKESNHMIKTKKEKDKKHIVDRKKKEQNPSKIQEVIYIIESLIKKSGSKYLVKWENYPADQNSWEPSTSIPKFVLKFYEEDLGRLGSPAPNL